MTELVGLCCSRRSRAVSRRCITAARPPYLQAAGTTVVVPSLGRSPCLKLAGALYSPPVGHTPDAPTLCGVRSRMPLALRSPCATFVGDFVAAAGGSGNDLAQPAIGLDRIARDTPSLGGRRPGVARGRPISRCSVR